MLAAIALSGWSVFVVRKFSTNRTTRSRLVADKFGLVLIAIGILWIAWLVLATKDRFEMFHTTGVVDKIENGRAEVTYSLRNGRLAAYDFPQFDNFSTLRTGESVPLLSEWKTAEVTSRTWVFTCLGTAAGALLIVGGWTARRVAPVPKNGSPSGSC